MEHGERKRLGAEEAFRLDAEVYEQLLRKFYVPLLRQAMRIEGDDVLSLLKIFQIAPDGAGKDFYDFEYDIRSPDHAILTFSRCPTLSYFEAEGNETDIRCLCGPGGVEDRAFQEFCRLTNPAMKCRPLQTPPRQSREGICCRWEFWVERTG